MWQNVLLSWQNKENRFPIEILKQSNKINTRKEVEDDDSDSDGDGDGDDEKELKSQ